MKKTLAAALAALTFGGAIAGAAIPTAAAAHDWDGDREWHGDRGWHRGWDRDRHRNNNNAAIIAGVAGLAIGAALADGRSHYRSGYSYGPGYYDYGYYPRVCESRRWVWDPYIGRRVMVTSRYEC